MVVVNAPRQRMVKLYELLVWNGQTGTFFVQGEAENDAELNARIREVEDCELAESGQPAIWKVVHTEVTRKSEYYPLYD